MLLITTDTTPPLLGIHTLYNDVIEPISTSTRKLMLRGPPAPISGPPHLKALAGECYQTKFKKYFIKTINN